MLGLLLVIPYGRSLAIAGLGGVVGTQIQGTEDVDGDLAVEAKAIETNGQNLFPVFIEGANLGGRARQQWELREASKRA